MENEHFSVFQITNCHMITIVNSPGRSSIKFYIGKLSPESNYSQKRYSFRIPFHPFWRLRGGVACYRHFKMSSDHTRVNGKKDCLIKIKLARYFAVSFFFSNKIVLTYSDLELFEQGSL